MSDAILINNSANGVTTVTLNRADKHNAFDDSIIKQLTAAFVEIDSDPNTRVMILAANGKSFSAGADLEWMRRMASYGYEDNLRDAKALATMLRTLNFMRKPTIARVQGAAFGGAVGLVSCCDIAIASTNASFSLSEVKIGLTPATISPYVVSAIGERAARRYFLTAERFFASKALQLGLLSEVVDIDALDATIESQINLILANSPAALVAAKDLIFSVNNRAVTDDLVTDTSERIAMIRVSEEGQEGLSAFLEKRNARWKQQD